MDERARQARNEYRRAWAKANPDKIKAQQARYWARQAEKIAAAKEGDKDAADAHNLTSG